MSEADAEGASEILVADGIRVSTWFWIAFGLAVLAVAPRALVAAGTEEIMAPSLYNSEYESPTYAFTQPLYLIVAALGFSLMMVLFGLRRPPVLRAGPKGVSLRGSGKANARSDWAELDRIVVWRRRVKRLGVIPVWEPQVGLVKDTERTRAFQAVASSKQWRAGDLRSNGVPDWLPGGIQKHSVRLSHRRAGAVAAAVARFAVHVEVVDERYPGRATPIEPEP